MPDFTTDSRGRRVYTNEAAARAYYTQLVNSQGGSYDYSPTGRQDTIDQFVRNSMAGWSIGAAPAATPTPTPTQEPAPQQPIDQMAGAYQGPSAVDLMGRGDKDTIVEQGWKAQSRQPTSTGRAQPPSSNTQRLMQLFRH